MFFAEVLANKLKLKLAFTRPEDPEPVLVSFVSFNQMVFIFFSNSPFYLSQGVSKLNISLKYGDREARG
jgi:hypothetical protein